MKFLDLIKEGRAEDFAQKYSNKFNKEQIRRVIDLITPRFLNWVGKNLDGVNFEVNLPKINAALQEFEKISSNLPKTDINSYIDENELFQAIQSYKDRPRRQVKQVEGGNVVYEDDQFFVVNPLTHQSSCYYGKGTKWCTTTETDYQFNKYNEDGKLFYVIDKRLKTDDPYYKVALLYKFDGGKSWWDAKDISFSKGWILESPEYQKLMASVDDYMKSQYKEQIDIWTNKELARKEKDRLERLRIQQRTRQLENEADERRANNEWDPTNPNIDDEGIKANVLFQWLIDNNDITPLTNEDRIEIQNLKNKIEELNQAYEESEDVRGDLLDEISDLEDELEEYNDRVDVYNIIPDGEFYNMTKFEVINAGLDGRGYAVGDASEMQESAEAYVEQLIDDIGYEGFSSSFAKGYIDEDAVVDYARDYYNDDVYANPEYFLDESERQLSDKQEENIKVLKMKIERTNEQIDRLESELGDNEEDDETIQEKIDELNDLVTEFESEIEEENDNPNGEFPDDLIEEKVDELVSDVKYDPESFMNEHGLQWSEYIDRESFIEGVIDADGYGIVNGYDGNYDEETFNNTLFYVMRID